MSTSAATFPALKRCLLLAAATLLSPGVEAILLPISTIEERVRRSDLIVVGTLSELKKLTLNHRDMARGLLIIDRILWGVEPKDRVVPLEWSNSSFIMCPRVGHSDSVGSACVWLLTFDDDGYVRADSSGSCLPLESIPDVQKCISDLGWSPWRPFVARAPARQLASFARELEANRRTLILGWALTSSLAGFGIIVVLAWRDGRVDRMGKVAEPGMWLGH